MEQAAGVRQGQACTQGPQCMPEELDWAEDLPEQRGAEAAASGTFLASQACGTGCLAASAHDRKQLQPSLRLPTPSPSQEDVH